MRAAIASGATNATSATNTAVFTVSTVSTPATPAIATTSTTQVSGGGFDLEVIAQQLETRRDGSGRLEGCDGGQRLGDCAVDGRPHRGQPLLRGRPPRAEVLREGGVGVGQRLSETVAGERRHRPRVAVVGAHYPRCAQCLFAICEWKLQRLFGGEMGAPTEAQQHVVEPCKPQRGVGATADQDVDSHVKRMAVDHQRRRHASLYDAHVQESFEIRRV